MPGRWRMVRAAGAATVIAAASVLAGPGAAQAGTCQPWTGTTAAGVPGTFANFVAVAAVSDCEVWAVGGTGTSPSDPTGRTLIEHWAGGQNWSVVPSPDPGSGDNSLQAVAADSASDVWMVGTAEPTSGFGQGLVLHWDGTSLTQVAAPGSVSLSGVAAISPHDVWVAGLDDNSQPLLLHYDGTGWTRTPAPATGGAFVELTGMTATSASDVWAVGSSRQAAGPQLGVTLHWDGSQWSQVATPDAPGPIEIRSVSASSPADAWAVGSAGTAPFFLHWDGQAWKTVPTPVPAGAVSGSELISAVTAVSPNSAWAAGRYATGNSTTGDRTLLLHWDGNSWTQVPDPHPDRDNVPFAVAPGPAGRLWVAGTDGSFDQPTVYEYGVVPNVAGDTPSVAATAVNNAGLGTTASFVTSPGGGCSTSTNGTVLGTSPAAGTFTGLPVSLTICQLPTSVAVPNVLQASDANARSAITGAGLTVGTVSTVANCTVGRGDVVTQNPNPGTVVAIGSSVSMTESTGKQPNGRPCIQN